MENIKAALYEAEGKGARKLIKELASSCEDFALAQEVFPEECMDLIVEILSEERLFTKSGIDVFLLKTSTDMYRLSEGQKARLLKAIFENYSRYADIDMCWLLGDLIARSYDRLTVLSTFRSLFSTATNQGKEGIALGLDVLARQSMQDAPLMKEIDEILHL